MRKEHAEHSKDVPQLRQIIDSTWRKEADLAALKKEMEQLDRRIQLALKPVGDNQDGEKVETEEGTVPQQKAPGSDDPQKHIPSRLRQIADASGDRIIIGGVPPHTEENLKHKKMKM